MRYIHIIIYISFFSVYSQVGIGTSNPESVLDIVSDNSGVLVPRLNNVESVADPRSGMLIYDTSTYSFKGYVNGAWRDISSPDVPPSVSKVSFSGKMFIGEVLSGTYVYSDNEGDLEGNSVYGWFKADDDSGTNVTVISGASGKDYVLTQEDSGFIAFGVIPVALTGNPTGSLMLSEFRKFDALSYGEISGPTGRIWLDRNLGAEGVAISYDDAQSFGDYYQWGRISDGHEDAMSSIVSGPLEDGSEEGNFVTSDSGDWLLMSDESRWGVPKSIHDPCPTGFRIPTLAEFNLEITAWEDGGKTVNFWELLKMPASGYRLYDGALGNQGVSAFYWTSNAVNSSVRSQALVFYYGGESTVILSDYDRVQGSCIRCIKEE